MKRLLTAVIAALSIIGGSIAHGRDWLSKGLLVWPAAVIMGLLTAWTIGIWNGFFVGFAPVIHFWFLRRNSAEAHASLSEIDFPGRHDLLLFKAQRWTSLAVSVVLVAFAVYVQAWWWIPAAIIAPWLTNLALLLFVPLVAEWSIDRPDKRMWTEGVFGLACLPEALLFMYLAGEGLRGWS